MRETSIDRIKKVLNRGWMSTSEIRKKVRMRYDKVLNLLTQMEQMGLVERMKLRYDNMWRLKQ